MALGKDQGDGRDRELAELAEAVRDLSRRVRRLEGMSEAAGDNPRLAVMPRRTPTTLESRLGSQYLNRAGIVALLLGASFAVHWAFSNNWIGAGAIIAAGMIGGVAVIALGQWFLRRNYAAFGLSLQALGLGALYITLWAGFQVYQVVPAAVALAGMIVITAATAGAAVAQNSELLAVFAFLGGYATPFLLSTGKNRQVELFVYLLVLTSGMVVTLAFRRWSRLLIAGFFACAIVSTAWFVSYYSDPAWRATLIFVSLLFALIIAGTLLVDRSSKGAFVVAPIATVAYLIAAAITWRNVAPYAAMVAAMFLLLSWKRTARVRTLYFSIAIACLAVAAPAEFDPHWETSVLWLVLGLVLMGIGFRTGLAFVRWDALVLIAVTIAKVFMYDLSRLGAGYRIVAMAVLGVALLAASFAYQRSRAVG